LSVTLFWHFSNDGKEGTNHVILIQFVHKKKGFLVHIWISLSVGNNCIVFGSFWGDLKNESFVFQKKKGICQI